MDPKAQFKQPKKKGKEGRTRYEQWDKHVFVGLWHSVVLCVVPGKVEGHLVTEGWSGVIHL